jgi:hypothetical protein
MKVACIVREFEKAPAASTLYTAASLTAAYSRHVCFLQEQPTSVQREQLPQLPACILQQVLSHVPLQQRLASCSLASRAMHAAAVAATEEISLELPEPFRSPELSSRLEDLNSQQKASELCQWLQRYGSQALRHLSVQAPMWQRVMLSLALPGSLQQLQSLNLRRVKLPDSCALPKLTSLSLEHCTVDPCSDVLAWVAQQASHLSGLQCMQLQLREQQRTDSSKAGALAFAEALGQFQQLTSLSLTSECTIRVKLSTISKLSQLQQLELRMIGTDEQLELGLILALMRSHSSCSGCQAA